jgi:cellulose biosynthesis protein BcsQ
MIVTFYSYKGGTGRTMAVANIACLLAKAGRRVLVVDFDLEAPGIWRYFDEFQRGLDRRPGLMDLLLGETAPGQGTTGAERPDWHQYTIRVRIGAASVTVMTSGLQDEGYPGRVLGFDWNDFFANQGGGEFFQRLRAEWNSAYDFVLIDSRTGITDIGGICTILLPDMIVPVFIANWQNLEGIVDTLRRAQRGRQELAYDRPPALVLPVLSRFESRTEVESANEWLSRAATMLAECYADWLPKNVEPRLMLEWTKLPHIAYFGFGERLAVQLQGTSDPDSLGYAYNTVARLIDSHLKDALEVIGGAQEPRTAVAVTQRLEPPTDTWIAQIYGRFDFPLGTGIVIDSARVLVPTHILDSAEPADIKVLLPRSDDRTARAVPRRVQLVSRGSDQGAGILQLDRALPPSEVPAPLGFPRARDLVGRRWWAFGFPREERLGTEASGTVGAALAYGSIRLDGGRSSFWRPGVSGAPVWSPDHGAVVAMVTGVHEDGFGAAITLAEVAADLPETGLADLAVPDSGAELDSQQREYLIDALAKVYDAQPGVERVLRELDLPPGSDQDFAHYSHPRLYWDRVLTDLENGRVPNGVSALVNAAAEQYPGNRAFRETSDYLRATTTAAREG